jgi:hypothetical protein
MKSLQIKLFSTASNMPEMWSGGKELGSNFSDCNTFLGNAKDYKI